MRPLRRTAFQGIASYENFYIALLNLSGEYCHICEKSVRNGAELLHRSRGILDSTATLDTTDYMHTFLLCGDCAYAFNNDFIFHYPRETAEMEDDDYGMKIEIKQKEKKTLDNTDQYFWPDTSYFDIYKASAIYHFHWQTVKWHQLDEFGLVLGTGPRQTLILAPKKDMIPDVQKRLERTIKLFRLNGWYHDYPENVALDNISFYVPPSATFDDLRPVIRNKVYKLTRTFIDQVSLLQSSGINAWHIINGQFQQLIELYGFWSLWNGSVLPPVEQPTPPPVPLLAASELMSDDPSILKRKRTDEPEDEGQDPKKPKPDNPEIDPETEQGQPSRKKRRDQ